MYLLSTRVAASFVVTVSLSSRPRTTTHYGTASTCSPHLKPRLKQVALHVIVPAKCHLERCLLSRSSIVVASNGCYSIPKIGPWTHIFPVSIRDLFKSLELFRCGVMRAASEMWDDQRRKRSHWKRGDNTITMTRMLDELIRSDPMTMNRYQNKIRVE